MKSTSNRRNPRIVLIDDDGHQAKFIIGGLKLLDQRFDIQYIGSADQAHKLLASGKWGDVALFLVDVMMPPGKAYAKQPTREGEITGFFVARDIRDALPNTPIILWSTDPLNIIEAKARKFIKDSIPRCAFLRKEDAIRKVMLCYQNFVDGGRLDDDAFKRLERWLKLLSPLGPIARALYGLWQASRGGGVTSPNELT
jgi:CheY-like chemotaxis protein